MFDDEGSYVENKQTEQLRIVEEDGDYILEAWVKTGQEEESTFGGQVRSP